jgi:MoaA/NifB/PqqE/SkfB family radical SAM enzyme
VTVGQVFRLAAGRLRKFFGGRSPLRVTHVITYRCNLTCTFCVLPTVDSELDTQEAKNAIDAFRRLGAVSWGFTGGEPFVRKDLLELSRYAKSRDLVSTIVTNGWFHDRAAEFSTADVDLVMISLEGGEADTDRLRGEGAYARALQSASHFRSAGIPISFEMVLSDNNLDAVETLVAIASDYGASCSFQPLFDMRNGREDADLVGDPRRLERLWANVDALIGMKKSGAPISSSYPYLNYLKNYGRESFRANYCFAAETYAFLLPDGGMKNCWWVGPDGSRAATYEEGFVRLKGTKRSCHCWAKCHGEYSAIFSGNPSAIANAFQLLR